MLLAFTLLIGAESSKELGVAESTSEEESFKEEFVVKNVEFQEQLAEIERERLFADSVKEQARIVKINDDKLAEEKRLAEEKALAEAEKLAEEKVLVQQSVKEEKVAESSGVAKSTKTASTTKKEPAKSAAKPSTAVTTQQSKPEPATANRTDGFNFNGHHFSLASFTGGGSVPRETNNVFQWTDKPNHYLIERVSPAGRVIRSVGVGTKVVINGTSYTVTNVEANIPNDDAAVDYLYKHNAAITFQTCETTKGPNGRSNVRFWYAR